MTAKKQKEAELPAVPEAAPEKITDIQGNVRKILAAQYAARVGDEAKAAIPPPTRYGVLLFSHVIRHPQTGEELAYGKPTATPLSADPFWDATEKSLNRDPAQLKMLLTEDKALADKAAAQVAAMEKAIRERLEAKEKGKA